MSFLTSIAMLFNPETNRMTQKPKPRPPKPPAPPPTEPLPAA